MRVTGGGKTGRVEVYYNNVWGVVCKEGWDFYDALVVCRQLGYEWVASGWSDVQASIGSETALLSGVQCDGTETNLDLCSGNGWAEYSCTADAPATVACYDLAEVDGLYTLLFRIKKRQFAFLTEKNPYSLVYVERFTFKDSGCEISL